jgi:hypothetical protein
MNGLCETCLCGIRSSGSDHTILSGEPQCIVSHRHQTAIASDR